MKLSKAQRLILAAMDLHDNKIVPKGRFGGYAHRGYQLTIGRSVHSRLTGCLWLPVGSVQSLRRLGLIKNKSVGYQITATGRAAIGGVA